MYHLAMFHPAFLHPMQLSHPFFSLIPARHLHLAGTHLTRRFPGLFPLLLPSNRFLPRIPLFLLIPAFFLHLFPVRMHPPNPILNLFRILSQIPDRQPTLLRYPVQFHLFPALYFHQNLSLLLPTPPRFSLRDFLPSTCSLLLPGFQPLPAHSPEYQTSTLLLIIQLKISIAIFSFSVSPLISMKISHARQVHPIPRRRAIPLSIIYFTVTFCGADHAE